MYAEALLARMRRRRRYTVVRKIGTGSYGAAYLVKLKADRRGDGGARARI